MKNCVKLLNFIIKNKKVLLILDILLIVLVIISYRYMYDMQIRKNKFSFEMEEFVKENENPVFRISKIILYKSAYAIDNSLDKTLEDISISQFTDIALYIDNKENSKELTARNTINELYIDNIKLNMNNDSGDYIFNYKNPEEYGKYKEIKNRENERIVFDIVKFNEENRCVNYENRVFYTDCTNPLTFGFINKDFFKNGVLKAQTGSLLFDGTILRSPEIDLSKLSGNISFLIHLKNNLGEDYICDLLINNDLINDSEILDGYSIQISNGEGAKFNFLKVN